MLPVPFSSYQWLRANSTVRGGLLALSSFAGVASCVIDMVALATSFAIYAKAVEWSFEFAAWRADQVSIITVTAFIIAVATIFRLMSEILLSTWLIVVGMAMWPSHTKWTAAVVLMLGLVTLMVAVIKLVYPANPIEDWLGLVLGCGFIFVGIGLLRAKFKT